MKASVWLQKVRHDFGMLYIMNESSTKIPWKVDYLITAAVLKLKKCPESALCKKGCYTRLYNIVIQVVIQYLLYTLRIIMYNCV